MKIFIAIFLISFSLTARAAQITYSFSGILNRIQDDYGFLNGEFSVGDAFRGSFTYLTNVPEGITTIEDHTTAIYSSIIDFNVNINGYEIDASPSGLAGYLQVWDDRVVGSSVVDAFTVSSPLDYTPPISSMGTGTVVAAANVNLFDFTHTASLLGTHIPTSVNLSDYDSLSFSALQLNTGTKESFYLNGTVANLSAVPNPASIYLFLSGLSLIYFCNKRLTSRSCRSGSSPALVDTFS